MPCFFSSELIHASISTKIDSKWPKLISLLLSSSGSILYSAGEHVQRWAKYFKIYRQKLWKDWRNWGDFKVRILIEFRSHMVGIFLLSYTWYTYTCQQCNWLLWGKLRGQKAASAQCHTIFGKQCPRFVFLCTSSSLIMAARLMEWQ